MSRWDKWLKKLEDYNQKRREEKTPTESKVPTCSVKSGDIDTDKKAPPPKNYTVQNQNDILNIIDDWSKEEKKYETTPQNKTLDQTKGYRDEELVSVAGTPIWAGFKYIYKPSYAGLEKLKHDPRLYFTINSGYEISQDGSLKMWYITFPYGGKEDEITEFFTSYTLPMNVGTEENK